MRSFLSFAFLAAAFLVFLTTSCKKATIELKNEGEFLSPPPPQCPLSTCNITDGQNYFYWFAKSLGSYEGELHYELSVQPAPYDFIYDQNNNPLSCEGFGFFTCYKKYLNSVFTYTNGKLSSISIDETYADPGCPGYVNLPNIHTGTRIDFAYSYRVVQVSGFPVFYPVTTATVYKSDTVPLGQDFTSFTASGRTYYYEYNVASTKLRIKRYKADASAVTKEFTYSYDADGHLTRMSLFENGNEKYRSTYYSWDTKKNFASGNAITQLLTSSYGKNNLRQWYTTYYTSFNTDYYDVDYLYNVYCYPAVATVTVDGFTYPANQISYACQ